MKPARLAFAAAAAFCALLAVPAGASADSCDYTGVGTWETAINWSCSHVPSAGDSAMIGSGDTVTLTAPGGVDSLTLDAGGELDFSGGSVLNVPVALTVTSGTLSGDGALTTGPSATVVKSTAGSLAVKNGVDLVLGGATTLAGGNICLSDDSGQDPTLMIAGVFTVAGGADATPFACGSGLDAAALIVGPGGQLLKSSAGTSAFATKLLIAGGTLQLDAGQTITSAGIEQSSGTTFLAAGASIDGASPATVSGGTFKVDGSFTGPATLTGGAVLTGSGTLNGPVIATAATIRPGSSPGTLTVAGDLTLGAGSTLEVEINGTTQGSGYDYLHVLGTATLGGALKLIQGGPEPLVSDVFAFLTSNARFGTFASLDAPALSLGKQYRLDYPGATSFGARLVLVQTPQNGAPPSADGATGAGSLLSCSTGSWIGTPAPSFSIQWLRDGEPIGGATTTTYTIGDADAAHAVACRVTANNDAGSVAAMSAARAIGAVAPELAGGPTVAGSGQAGSVATCQTGSWTGFPAPALAVQWLRDGQLAGVDGPQYAIAPQDAGHSVACVVTATNVAGSNGATSNALAVAKNPEQVLTGSSPSSVAAAIGLPSSSRCLKDRYLRIRVRQPSGVRIAAVSVLGNGKKNKANKTAGRFNTSFDLRHISKKTLTVRITITAESGMKSVAERKYRICLPKRKPARKR